MMRTTIAALLATLSTFPAFAHSGHGEIEYLHHDVFSALNWADSLPLLAIAAVAAAILTKRFR